MDKTLETQLTETLKDLSTTASQIKTFTLEQTPDLIQQLLIYSMLDTILSLLFWSTTIWISYKFFTKWSDQTSIHEWSTSKITSAVIGGLLSSIAIFFILSDISTILKITTAPKLYILQYIATSIK